MLPMVVYFYLLYTRVVLVQQDLEIHMNYACRLPLYSIPLPLLTMLVVNGASSNVENSLSFQIHIG